MVLFSTWPIILPNKEQIIKTTFIEKNKIIKVLLEQIACHLANKKIFEEPGKVHFTKTMCLEFGTPAYFLQFWTDNLGNHSF